MDLNLHAAIEKIKHGDIKSAMDQLHFLTSEIVLLNAQVENLYAELAKKVNLTSQALNGALNKTVLGSGVVSVNGTNIDGIGTSFKTECAVGNLIKVGLESATITNIDNDTSITTNVSLTACSNQIYAIVKNATQELLTGDFQFGELNGDRYNGVITQDSTLQHFGRMTSPNDVVNVQFVQRAVNPAMARALNAIQRDGDIVGLETVESIYDRYNYLFRNINLILGDPSLGNTDAKYYGPIEDNNHILVKKSLDDAIFAITQKRYFTTPWYTDSIPIGQTTFHNCEDLITITGTNEITITSPTTQQYVALLVGHVKASWQYNGQHDFDNRCQMIPYVNGIAQNVFEHNVHLSVHDVDAALSGNPLISCSQPITFNGGSKIKFVVIPVGITHINGIQWSLLFI